MAATLSTKQIKDGGGGLFLQRVLDASGGNGPVLPIQALAGPDGAVVDLAALFAGVVTAVRAQRLVLTTTISIGENLSTPVNLGTGLLVGLIVPANWTNAPITFQTSADGTTFTDLFDGSTERALAADSIVPGRTIALPYSDWFQSVALRIRSGATDNPVNQSAARTIQLVVV